VSPVKYEMGFYITEDDILQYETSSSTVQCVYTEMFSLWICFKVCKCFHFQASIVSYLTRRIQIPVSIFRLSRGLTLGSTNGAHVEILF
jgi:hypothetical protein